MKVRNLLLAGLAVAAMTACSNNDEIVDNGIQAPVEEASMRINLKFANETTTRAHGGTDIGDAVERTSTTVTAIIEYPNSSKRLVVKDLDLVGAEADGVYQTEPFSVESGTGVNVYAIINHTDDYEEVEATSALNDLKVGVHTLPEAGLAYIAGTVAKNGNFLMSGSASNLNIVAGSDENVAPITVDRVAAKLDEMTTLTTNFPIATDYNVTGGAITVKLLGYSYSNLSSDSYIFNQAGSPESWLQVYEPVAANADDDTYRWITDDVTYCLENKSENQTKVHYKGQVYIGEDAAGDFFIRAVNLDGTTTYRLFTSWDDLTAYYNDATISGLDQTDTATLANYGIKKYTGGICYYEAPIATYGPSTEEIESAVSFVVLRNNWYQLTVNSISKIGFPTPAPDPDGDPTMLTIQTTVNPWTIQINGFDL